MTSTSPLVSIGLPVYNGARHVSIALESLLAQDYPNIEILISDNATIDETQAICQRLIADRENAHYARNSENIGPFRNYLSTLDRAKGEFFLWASHDDKWAPQFVSSLVKTLQENPDSPLATPAILHIDVDGGLRNDPPDRPAPGESLAGNLRVLYDDHAASWVYGMYRTPWLRERVGDWGEYPLWGSDVMWLADLCLQYRLTGSPDAILYKRLRPSGYAPSTARAIVAFWGYMFYFFTKITWRRVADWRQRLRLTTWAWRYVYRLAIHRPGILRTAWRIARLLAIAGITSLPHAVSWMAKQLIPPRSTVAAAGANSIAPPTQSTTAASRAASETIASEANTRRAA